MSDPGKRRSGTPAGETGETRRDFLNEIAGGALGIAGLGSAVVTYSILRRMSCLNRPRLFARAIPISTRSIPSPTFRTSRSTSSAPPQGFYAVSAVCTHLGCITQWKPEADQIACPCHGSKFT